MPALTFIILPPGVAKLHEILLCLAKFDENISLEASADHVSIRISVRPSPGLTTPVTSYQSQHFKDSTCFVHT
jgi:hypothetical protein